ncbi:unnamed protein product, partial [Laminaria digitata]
PPTPSPDALLRATTSSSATRTCTPRKMHSSPPRSPSTYSSTNHNGLRQPHRRPAQRFYRVVYDHHTTTGPRSEPATPDITTTHCPSSDHRAPTALLPHRPRPTGRHRLALGASQRTLSRPLTAFHWTFIRTAPTPSGSSSTLTPSSSTS